MNIGLALAALAPSVGIGVIFWVVIRAIMNADRTERAAMARMDAADAAERAAAEQNSTPVDS
ncbi:MAG TPA: hypothetical protein VGC67_06395 [Cellulomonas sp.]